MDPLLVLSGCLLCFIGIFGQDPPCTGRDQCSCVTADNQVIDLSSVGNNDGSSKFTDIQAPDGYMYSFNPCYPFSELACADQSVCQVPPDKSTAYQAGDANSAVFTNDGINNHIQYSSTGGDGVTRSSDLTLICDPSASTPSFQPLGEQGTGIYYLTLTTKCACPDGCAGSGPQPGPGPGPGKRNNGGDSGLSIGSILVIVVVSIGAVYFVGGVAFLMFVKKARGKEAIPNSGFWVSVPGNVKNGFMFVYCKIRGQQFTAYSSV